MADERSRTIAIGTYLYDGLVPRQLELVALPAECSASRWIYDEEADERVLDPNTPIPQTADGHVYFIRWAGSEFMSAAEAMAWADQQPWGPVHWTMLPDGS